MYHVYIHILYMDVFPGGSAVKNLPALQVLSLVWLFATPWTAACQASLLLTISWSLPRFMSIASVMPSNHLILCCPLLLLPSIFPIIRLFSNESALRIRWPKYWHFSVSISPSNASHNTRFNPWVSKVLWKRKWQPTTILAWKIPWREESGELESMGWQGSDIT